MTTRAASFAQLLISEWARAYWELRLVPAALAVVSPLQVRRNWVSPHVWSYSLEG
jgi:hypothetical protein